MVNVVMDAESSLQKKPRENDVMDVEESLHQKPRDDCITEDTASIDLGWLENTKLPRLKNGTRCLLEVGVRDWESHGALPSMIQKGFCETVADVMDAEGKEDDEIHLSKRQRVAERVPIHVPLVVEPENHDFDVNEFLRSSPNPVVASFFFFEIPRSSEERQYAVDILSLTSRFLNFGEIGQRANSGHGSKNSTATFGFGISKPGMVAHSQLCHLSSNQRERIDGERAAELAIFDWVVSLCEVEETAGNMFFLENPAGASLKDPCSRRDLKRPVRCLTNSRELLKFVIRQCSRKHVHGPVKGLTNAYRSSSR